MKYVILMGLLIGLCTPQLVYGQSPSDGRTHLPIPVLGKGNWHTGLTFGLNNREAENEQQLLRLIKDQSKLGYSVSGLGGYFIKDEFSVGLSLGYRRNQQDITYVSDSKEFTQNTVAYDVKIAPFIRNYLTFKGLSFLAIFNQTSLIFTYGQSLDQVLQGETLNKTLSDLYTLKVGIEPGLVVFIANGFAFEASVELLGLSTTVETAVTNYTEESRVVSNEVNFTINLLTLNLGVAYYF